MFSLEKSIVINRSVEDVFAFVSNSENRPKWVPVKEVQKTTAGPIGVGTTFSNVIKMMGRDQVSSLEVVEYLPNQAYTFKTDWPFPCHLHHTLNPIEDGTQVTLRLEAQLSGFFKLLQPFMLQTSQRQMDLDLAALKTCLETDEKQKQKKHIET
jgi:uncharacterized protein YndB with AHSA1/START domain